ncbi:MULTISPECIES: hypothetical protein [unclassified Micromonospora]|uniref:DUF7144 family membrane protein n=1 Tax=unclassified Micromonospora TaxID=2617518 RepID=UPI001C5E9077|nr:hypothetical protein [Micromonospora sp. RL09-050-HVF-A]MBW4703991.1 hypothetical protein [Micromonospora sp. RL09-050-HVF-A]
MTTRQPDRSLLLAGGLLVGAGLFDVLSGIGDVDSGDVYVSLHADGLVFYDLTNWAWLHVASGVLLVATGLATAFGRRPWTTAALVVGAAVVVVHLLFAPYHPIEALIVVGLVLAALRLVVRHRRGNRDDARVRTADRPSR